MATAVRKKKLLVSALVLLLFALALSNIAFSGSQTERTARRGDDDRNIETILSIYREKLPTIATDASSRRSTGSSAHKDNDYTHVLDALRQRQLSEDASRTRSLGNNSTVGTAASAVPQEPHRHRRRLEFVHIPKTGGTAIESAAASMMNISWGVCHFAGRAHAMWMSKNKTRCPRTSSPTSGKELKHIYIVPQWHVPPHYFERYSSHNSNNSAYGDFNPYHNASLFAVVRNPYERLISHYYYFFSEVSTTKSQIDKRHDAKFMNDFLRGRLLRMKDAIMASASVASTTTTAVTGADAGGAIFPPRPKNYYTNFGHMIPQYDFVYDDNYDGDDKVMKKTTAAATTAETSSVRKVVDHVLRFESLHEEFPRLMRQYGLERIVLNSGGALGRQNFDKVLGVANMTLENIRLVEWVYARDFAAFGYPTISSKLHELENQLDGTDELDNDARQQQ